MARMFSRMSSVCVAYLLRSIRRIYQNNLPKNLYHKRIQKKPQPQGESRH